MSQILPPDILKGYFQKGSFPTQAQFAALIDSMRHKGEKLELTDVSRLTELLNDKYSRSEGQALLEQAMEAVKDASGSTQRLKELEKSVGMPLYRFDKVLFNASPSSVTPAAAGCAGKEVVLFLNEDYSVNRVCICNNEASGWVNIPRPGAISLTEPAWTMPDCVELYSVQRPGGVMEAGNFILRRGAIFVASGAQSIDPAATAPNDFAALYLTDQSGNLLPLISGAPAEAPQSDCILDIGKVDNFAAAASRAAEDDITTNPRIRMIIYRTSDAPAVTAGERAGHSGVIFQEKRDWQVIQWAMFTPNDYRCKARRIVLGAEANKNVGDWQPLILPTKFAFNPDTRKLTATLPFNINNKNGSTTVDASDALPLATTTKAGLMGADDKSKLSQLPTNSALTQTLNGKVDAEPGKGLSTHDFSTDQLIRLANTGLYGRNAGRKYAVRNLFALTRESKDKEIREALTSSDGVRLLETDLAYCAENGCCLLDETTGGFIMVNKVTNSSSMFNLIEISSPKVGEPEVTTLQLPAMRLITLSSVADENIPLEEWTPENAIWHCFRVLQEKFAYQANLDTKLDKIPNAIYTKELGGDGITIFYNITDGHPQPLTMVCPSAGFMVYGTALINGQFSSQGQVLLGQTTTDPSATYLGSRARIGNNVTLPDNFTPLQPFIDYWNTVWAGSGSYDPEHAPDPDHPFLGNGIYMTYAEALAVVAAGQIINNANAFYSGQNIRTNLPRRAATSAMEYSYTFSNNSTIEIASCQNAKIANQAFRNCLRLRKIIGVGASIYTINAADNPANVFTNCKNLEYVEGYIRGTLPIDVRDCPKLTYENFAWWVDHALNTATVPITVHPDIFAKLTGNTSNPAAAALTANELAQWMALVETAASKNIQFATV